MVVGVKGGDQIGAALAKLASGIATGDVARAGFLENATYPDGTSVAMVAAVNEFGRPDHNQPPRPFFRSAIADNKGKWADTLGKLLKSGADIQTALEMVGEVMTGDIQMSIRKLASPKLAPSTVKAKGFDKPLIDTSHMLHSVAHDVKKPE